MSVCLSHQKPRGTKRLDTLSVEENRPSLWLQPHSLPLFYISEDARERGCLLTGAPPDHRCFCLSAQFLIMSSPGPKETSQRDLSELDTEHTQKVLEMEHTQQLKLKERQKFFEEAFQQDMEQYLSTGYLQTAERREPMGSMSSMEVNVDVLEQMDLMDISDQEALDVFLNSGGEDNIVMSPEMESSPSQNEMSLQIPNPSESASQPPTSPSACTDLDTADAPLIQSDEEEVQVDTALVTLHTDRKSAPGVSDDSDQCDSTQDI